MDRDRKGETGEHQLFAFLTTAANDVVRPTHAKAMPMLLTTAEEWDAWLTASIGEAVALQRPLPIDLLRVVTTGGKSDRPPAPGANSVASASATVGTLQAEAWLTEGALRIYSGRRLALERTRARNNVIRNTKTKLAPF